MCARAVCNGWVDRGELPACGNQVRGEEAPCYLAVWKIRQLWGPPLQKERDQKGSGASGWLGWADRQTDGSPSPGGKPKGELGSEGDLDKLTDRRTDIASFGEGLTYSAGNGAGCH